MKLQTTSIKVINLSYLAEIAKKMQAQKVHKDAIGELKEYKLPLVVSNILSEIENFWSGNSYNFLIPITLYIDSIQGNIEALEYSDKAMDYVDFIMQYENEEIYINPCK